MDQPLDCVPAHTAPQPPEQPSSDLPGLLEQSEEPKNKTVEGNHLHVLRALEKAFTELTSISDFQDLVELHSLKWFYGKKKSLIFSLDFETLFTKHTPCEILGPNFEKKTVYLNYNFPIYWSAIITPVTQPAVCEHSLLIMQNTNVRI